MSKMYRYAVSIPAPTRLAYCIRGTNSESKDLFEKGGFAMAYFPPVPVIRRNHIITTLRQHGAVSKETAMTLSEAGVINPNGFRKITELLCRRGILRQNGERYYLGIR